MLLAFGIASVIHIILVLLIKGEALLHAVAVQDAKGCPSSVARDGICKAFT